MRFLSGNSLPDCTEYRGCSCNICPVGPCNVLTRSVWHAAAGCARTMPPAISAAIAALPCTTYRLRWVHGFGCARVLWARPRSPPASSLDASLRSYQQILFHLKQIRGIELLSCVIFGHVEQSLVFRRAPKKLSGRWGNRPLVGDGGTSNTSTRTMGCSVRVKVLCPFVPQTGSGATCDAPTKAWRL